MSFIIGCDIGTQSIKAVLLGEAGSVVARAASSHGTTYPYPGWAEQDPQAWIDGLSAAVRTLLATARVDPAAVVAIGVAGQVDGIVATDDRGRPLAAAPIWMDRRATAEAARFADRAGAGAIRAITGLNPDASHGVPKIAWLRDRVPGAAWYLVPTAYVVAWLTGERAMDPANASCSMLWDLAAGTWSQPLLEAAEIDPGMLGAVLPAAHVLGSLRPQAAALGLSERCRVVVGTGDEHAACLAAGILDPGVVGDVTGTAEPVAAASDRPLVDPSGLVETHPHAVPDRFLVENPGFVSGGSVRWLADDVLGCRQEEIAELAAAAPAGSAGVLFLPALSGAVTPRWNEWARGAFTGLGLGTRAAAPRPRSPRGVRLCAARHRRPAGGARAGGRGPPRPRRRGAQRALAADQGGRHRPAGTDAPGARGDRDGRRPARRDRRGLVSRCRCRRARNAAARHDDGGAGPTRSRPVRRGIRAVPRAVGCPRADVRPAGGRAVKTARASIHLDPRDIPKIERSLGLDRDGARLRRIGLRRIDIAWDALDRLPQIVADVARPGPIAILMDAVPMYRGADLLKPAVARRLAVLGDVRVVQIGTPGAELHADLAAIAEARAGADGAGCLVAVGSGTICDIGKEASRHLGLPYVVVQTANSVNAFGDDMAVLLLHGVKRTVTSRWPDALVVDLGVIADAPAALNQAGVGELAAMFTAPADWRLAKAFGMDDSWDPRPVALFRDGGAALVDAGARLARGDRTALEPLVELMTLSGLALGVAGRTAPISGLEHTVSHLLDMAAAQRGTRTGLHGAQVGVAALAVAVAWRRLLDELDPERLRDAPPPDPAAIRARIDDAFGALDASGSIEAECAAAYTRKLERWVGATGARSEAIADWDAVRAELRELVGSPESIAAVLRGGGAPAAFGELDPSVTRDTGAWALYNGHLQRDRFSVADLAAAAGCWTETFVHEVIEEAEALAAVARAGVERVGGEGKPTTGVVAGHPDHRDGA